MTDTDRPGDDRETARRAAAAHTVAARDLESFLRTLPTTPGPEHVAEYATLLSREERARADRQAAVDALGLTVGSIEPG
ncbi:hypothetical protein CA850_03580 [Micromonospora echinospora]|uniref:Uncharacterized protein n=1 Tax=Micromonospora echinospora TaxID=1877 RepID=A0A1C5A1H7_MICEC|nr:hypothetical protein [Micromonospora echinospora]OZV84020.1 hypothetical protein CA850_03580 [Micromonospora echinospora]SCF39043.1 hypothetical protein GA0070618_6129 [Micromonospora echinospora]